MEHLHSRGRRDGRWALLAALAALAIAWLPRFWMYLTSGPHRVFLGEIWGAYDLPPYIESIRDGMHGSWAFNGRTWGTPDGSSYWLYGFYPALGQLSSHSHLSPLQVMEIGRWITAVLMFLCTWLFMRRALAEGQRGFAFFAATLAGGAGFLALVIHLRLPLGPVIPEDVVTPGFNLLNSLHMAPHVALSVACLAIFGWAVLAAADGQWRGLAGVPAVAMVASFHPFVLPAPLMAAGLLFLFRSRNRQLLWLLTLSALACVPFAVYLFQLSAHDPLFSRQQVNAQISTAIESLPGEVVGRLWLWPAILIGAVAAFRKRQTALAFSLLWASIALALALAPQLQNSALHRSLEGEVLAWAVLAGYGFPALARGWRLLLMTLMLITPVFQLPALFIAGCADPSAWLDRGSYQIAQRLDRSAAHGHLLGDYQDMRWVVALSGLRETSDDPRLVRSQMDDLAKAPADQQAQLARSDGADYVIWGEEEQHRLGDPPKGLRLQDGEGNSELLQTQPTPTPAS